VHVRIPVQDFKSLHVAIMICASEVDTRRQTASDQLLIDRLID